MRSALVVLVLLAPLALAAPPAEHVHVLTSEASTIDVEVHYADGVGSTRFAFVQLTGPTGSTVDRLKPTPECTEWIGTFTQAAVLAGSDDSVASALVRFVGPEEVVPLAAPRQYADMPLDVEVVGNVGGLSGRILVCDQASGGLVHLTLRPVGAAPAAVRVSLEATS